jgi:hypothetical protein
VFIAKSRCFHTSLFKNSEILPLPCGYILSSINFTANNKNCIQINPYTALLIQGINSIFHRSVSDLSYSQRSTYCAGLKMCNCLSSRLESLLNEKAKFKAASRRYFNTYSSYSVYEFLMFKNDSQSYYQLCTV